MVKNGSELKEYKELLVSDAFKNSVKQNKICLFLGAGVAKNLGMPSWSELASEIANCCLKEDILKHSTIHTLNLLNDPLKIISYCVSKIYEKKKEKYLTSILKEKFVEIPEKYYEKTNIYKDLVELYKSGKVLIVQTNYDNTIFKNCKLNTAQIYVPYKDEKKKDGVDNSLLVYLHGKIDESPSDMPVSINDLILTRSNYNSVYVNQNDLKYEKQKKFIKLLLENYHIIFLGYSLQDNEIIQLIANKGEVENYLETSVIIDNCDAKQIQNEITANYLSAFSNENLKLYYYNTENYGIKKNFIKVIKDLKKAILKKPETQNLQIHKTGEGVIFD